MTVTAKTAIDDIGLELTLEHDRVPVGGTLKGRLALSSTRDVAARSVRVSLVGREWWQHEPGTPTETRRRTLLHHRA